MLNRIDQVQNDFLLQPRLERRSDQVPQQIRNTGHLPVPDVGTAPDICVSVHQAGRELVPEFGWQGQENGSVRAGKFATIRASSGRTLGALAHVFAPDDKKWPLDIIYFDGAGGDAALVGKGLGTSWAGNSIEHQRMRVPVQEAVFRRRAGS